MKNVSVILKVLAVVAAIVGIVFLVATYGDRIVAWFKRLLGKKRFADDFDCDGNCEDCDCDCNFEYDENDEIAADEDFDE